MKLHCIMNFHNEELLMKDWILHHRSIYDEVLLVNHRSVDSSLDLIKEYAPDHWKLIDTTTTCFDAQANDNELMKLEELSYDGNRWIYVSNTTEFIWKKSLKEYLEIQDTAGHSCIGMRNYILIDKEENEINPDEPLYKTRHHGYKDTYGHRRWRYVHKHKNGAYTTGRHTVNHGSFHDPDLYMLYFGLSPWPACLPRKTQIAGQMPLSDKKKGLGFQHLLTEADHRKNWATAQKDNLLELPEFKEQYDYFVNSYGK